MADVTRIHSTQHDVKQKTPQKQTTFFSPKGNEKQIDYILTKRRYLRYNKDAEANDMIHMGSDHRCVMATFTSTTPGKNSHYKTIKGKHEIMKHEKRDQTEKTSKLRSLSLKKDTKRSSIFFTPPQKTAPQAESEDAKAQAKIENAAAAEAICENAEAEAEEVERMCTGSMMNDSVETAGEAGGRHPGHPGLHTVY